MTVSNKKLQINPRRDKNVSLKWLTIGLETQKHTLEKSLEKNRLGHALLFIGPENVGKTALAIDLARILMCTDKSSKPCAECFGCRIALYSGANFVCIDEEDEYSVDQIRKISSNFRIKPFSGTSNVAVLTNVQNMNTESANAFLKILEEPKEKTFFILTSNNSSSVPLTILSRCQRVYFGLSEKIQIKKALVNASQNRKIEEICFSRLGLAIRFLKTPEDFDTFSAHKESLFKMLSAPLDEKLQLAQELSQKEKPELNILIKFWILAFQEYFGLQVADSQLKKNLIFMKSLVNVYDGLKMNLNTKLLFDNLATAII